MKNMQRYFLCPEQCLQVFASVPPTCVKKETQPTLNILIFSPHESDSHTSWSGLDSVTCCWALNWAEGEAGSQTDLSDPSDKLSQSRVTRSRAADL